MKAITKYKILNKYTILSLISMLFVLWISWAFVSNFIEILTMDYFAPDLAVKTQQEANQVRYEYIISILSWETYIDSAMSYVVYIFPLFALITVLPFYNELKSYYVFGANRFRSYKKEVLRGVFSHALIGGLLIVLVFAVFFSVGSIFMLPAITDIGGYASILPDGFYSKHPYLFFMFMTVTIYFTIGFVFALLGCGIALVSNKPHNIIIIPMIAYIADAYILGGFFGFPNYQIFHSVGAFNVTTTTFQTFIPILPFLIAAIIVLIIGVKRNKSIIGDI